MEWEKARSRMRQKIKDALHQDMAEDTRIGYILDEIIQPEWVNGFELCKTKVLEILREVGDLGDGDYVSETVSELSAIEGEEI